uniref:Uncharacterized protein n=1 Tax=Panagrellus redivivus TaxID=6233 RepID=A0A7E4UX51_PANRE
MTLEPSNSSDSLDSAWEPSVPTTGPFHLHYNGYSNQHAPPKKIYNYFTNSAFGPPYDNDDAEDQDDEYSYHESHNPYVNNFEDANGQYDNYQDDDNQYYESVYANPTYSDNNEEDQFSSDGNYLHAPYPQGPEDSDNDEQHGYDNFDFD